MFKFVTLLVLGYKFSWNWYKLPENSLKLNATHFVHVCTLESMLKGRKYQNNSFNLPQKVSNAQHRHVIVLALHKKMYVSWINAWHVIFIYNTCIDQQEP